MRKSFFLLLIPSLALAGGPKYTYPNVRGLDDEMNNVYHDINNPHINYAVVSSMTFNQNSIGAGSTALGTNCPAVTVGAPYTWLVMISSDGSKVFIPAWK